MARVRGPNIITDGLVFHVDQGNHMSYPGEPTTNLLTSGPYSATNVTVTDVVAVDPWGNESTVQQTTITSATGAVRWAIDSSIGIPVQNQWYTISMWLKRIGSIDVTCGWEAELGSGDSYQRPNMELGFTGVYQGHPNTRTAPTEWERHYYTFQYTTVPTTAVVEFFYFSGNGGVALTTGYQVEALDHPTQYTATSRSSTGLITDRTKNRLAVNCYTPYFSGYADNPFDPRFQFDGTDNSQYIWFGGSDSVLTGVTNDSHTYECWAKLLGSITGTYDGYFFGRRGYHSGFRQVKSTNDTGCILWYSDITSNGTSSANLGSAWHHLVFSVDNSAKLAYYYVDGVQVGSPINFSGKTLRNYGTADYFIGSGSGTAYTGNVEVAIARIYNRAITQAEALRNFEAHRTRFGV